METTDINDTETASESKAALGPTRSTQLLKEDDERLMDLVGEYGAGVSVAYVLRRVVSAGLAAMGKKSVEAQR